MPSEGFEPAIPEIKHLQTDPLERTAIGIVAIIIVINDIIII
jgi:hypothetical protein